MKFLVFNIIVAASLYYLATDAKPDLAQLESQAQKAAIQASDWTRKQLRSQIQPKEAVAQPTVPADKQPGSKPRVNIAAAGISQPQAAMGAKPQPEQASPKTEEEKRKPVKQPKVRALAEQIPPVAQEVAPVKTATLPVTDPDVARRRAEVLNFERKDTVKIAEGQSLMTNREHKRNLHALAEEMEFRFIEWNGE